MRNNNLRLFKAKFCGKTEGIQLQITDFLNRTYLTTQQHFIDDITESQQLEKTRTNNNYLIKQHFTNDRAEPQ